ncbi:UpxY family transcription antiterminator [Robertkochia flava]|uniref:UpxY family transcription antiterminator n=1 Tax=Robertkochia flava TaxID=3447986 RepID=UPI001CCAAE84|nr:UpxY family transcription antiterminator [Robertkochia marina]
MADKSYWLRLPSLLGGNNRNVEGLLLPSGKSKVGKEEDQVTVNSIRNYYLCTQYKISQPMQWMVLCTRPRWEKKVASQLEEAGIEVYCPIVTEVRQWSDRKKKVKRPLFNSYVFVKMEENRRNAVFEVPGVVRFLFWLGKPAVVRKEEILLLREWLDGKVYDEARLLDLSPGQEVKINSGAFKGQEAIVEETRNNKIKIRLPKLNCLVVLHPSEVQG